ncbi:MAG: hypothetical protein L6R38_001006 [Xanthoria sp. 2 TBL-2021]|nr:MAG: hypothetical protein L6R38_001006 [Xanthoria sp. 2 TBL-2021]
MTLRARDVALAATFVFIAWGFATHWIPLLRYLGYAFTAGFLVALIAFGVLGACTFKKKHDANRRPVRSPTSLALTAPNGWQHGITWLSEQALYKREPLYPPSFVISESLDGLLDWLLRDLVSSWYQNITDCPSFVNSIDNAIRLALIDLRRRAFAIDPVEVGVSRIIPIITRHLKDFYEAERIIRGKTLNRSVNDSEELDLAIAAKYKDGRLHPAASLAYSDLKVVQQEYIRKIVLRLLPEVLPENIIKSRAVSVLIREIVSCSVIAPLLQLLSDPDTWNQLLEAYGRAMLQDRKSVRKVRAALDEHASPAPKTLSPRTFRRLSPQDDERKFERFVRAIWQCNNLSEARRFRSEVASQLKRESMIEGQDQTYLRRLETGKQLLDQRVGKLSAVGSSSATRRPQNDMKTGTGSTKPINLSIVQLLHDSTGLSYFMEYMDRHQLMTLVQFWIVVDGFRYPLEDSSAGIDSLAGTYGQWTEADRMDIMQIYETYLTKPELKVPPESHGAIQMFLKAGQAASMSQYLRARRAILNVQSAVLEELQDTHYPGFKRSDLYYKYLTFEDSAGKGKRPLARTLKEPSVDPIPESPSRPAPISRGSSRLNTARLELRRNASSNNDLKGAAKAMENGFQPQSRRSLDVDTSGPLFDDDVDSDLDTMMRSTHSIDESVSGDLDDGNKDHMVEAMEAALSNIMTDDPRVENPRGGLFEDSDLPSSATKAPESPRSSGEFLRVESGFLDKDKQRPSIASLGLVNTSSRIGVFTDDDLFGDEGKFSEDEHVSSEGLADDKPLDEEIHEAKPGDLGLAEAISALTADIDRLVAQEAVVDALNRKAELTNNVAELRILGKSKSSLQRETRRKELQRQQYMVQESDNSLYGRASVNIKSIMVGREEDGQEFALYVIEVTRKANEQMSAASWAVARRYSEFHDLHHRLRRLYPAVRELDFPRRRLVLKLQRDFLHKRRISLQNYLRELLQMPAVCQSRALRAFLSQSAIVSKQDTGRDTERRDIVSRIYNSVTDGMDEFLGNVPVLDQLSIAGQNLISAATNQFNSMPPATASSTSPSTNTNDPKALLDAADPLHSVEARAELDAFDSNARELEPFVKPICDLFLETFELNRGNNWLRGRAVVVVLHQLLGGTVERKVRDTVKAFAAEDSIMKYINQLKESFWPGGGAMRKESTVKTEADKSKSRREATVLLATLVPDVAGSVVGRANAQAASRRIAATVNNRRLMTHLVFTILDEVIHVLFPPVDRRLAQAQSSG